MADELVLFWHRRDLRIRDNLGLAAARARTSKVIGMFCLDPGILDSDDIAPARVAYMMGSLAELQESYKAAGSELSGVAIDLAGDEETVGGQCFCDR